MAQQGDITDRAVRVREELSSLAATMVASARSLLRPWRRSFIGRVRDLLLAWRQSAAEQRYLANLSERDLRDLGLSRDDEARDSAQFFWRR